MRAIVPGVSVIVPTYNRPAMLERAVESVLAQTYREFEIIVVNDGGVDVSTFLGCYRDCGLTLVQHGRNLGLAAARNSGLGVARREHVAFLDDDDAFFPHHLEALTRALGMRQARVAYSDAERAIQEAVGDGTYRTVRRDRPYSNDFDRQRLLGANLFPVNCLVAERAAVVEVGGFDESLSSHEDWDLWLRLSATCAFVHLAEVTCEFTWREDGSSMTSSRYDDMRRTFALVHARHNGGGQ